jgi:hypothetical protein
MKNKKLLSVFVGCGMLLLAGCTLASPQIPIDEGDVITIVEPVEGTQFQVGDLVKVRALVSSSLGAQDIDLFINGDIVRRDQLDVLLRQGNLLQPWQPPEPGEYLLQLTMTTSAGNIVQSNAVLISVKGEELPPTAEIESTTQISEPVATITASLTMLPTETLTVTPFPTITPSLTFPPTNTFVPTEEPLTAPEPIAPGGTYSCRSTIFLEWNAVYSANGISYYEWIVEAPGGLESGTTTEYRVEYFIPSCSASYQWKVRAVDNLGNIGPYTEMIPFTIE